MVDEMRVQRNAGVSEEHIGKSKRSLSTCTSLFSFRLKFMIEEWKVPW